MAVKTGLIGSVDLDEWGKADIIGAAYAKGGRQAIQLFNEEGPLVTLTVNLPDEPLLSEDDIFVKTWTENEEIAAELLAKCGDLFEDTGRAVPSGWVEAAVWKFKG